MFSYLVLQRRTSGDVQERKRCRKFILWQEVETVTVANFKFLKRSEVLEVHFRPKISDLIDKRLQKCEERWEQMLLEQHHQQILATHDPKCSKDDKSLQTPFH